MSPNFESIWNVKSISEILIMILNLVKFLEIMKNPLKSLRIVGLIFFVENDTEKITKNHLIFGFLSTVEYCRYFCIAEIIFISFLFYSKVSIKCFKFLGGKYYVCLDFKCRFLMGLLKHLLKFVEGLAVFLLLWIEISYQCFRAFSEISKTRENLNFSNIDFRIKFFNWVPLNC